MKHKSQRARKRKLQKKVNPETTGPLINKLFAMNRHDRRAYMAQYRSHLVEESKKT